MEMKKRKTQYPGIVQCLNCDTILVSFDRHDYKTCNCPNRTMVDGGTDYLRCGGVDMSKVQILKIVKPKRTK